MIFVVSQRSAFFMRAARSAVVIDFNRASEGKAASS